MIRETLCAALLILGTFLMLVAAVGVVRMPDVFMRMSSATKATTLGLASLLLAALIVFPELGVQGRAVAIIVFVFLTAPVSAHALARASYLAGVELWKGTTTDQLRGCYGRRTHRLGSTFRKRGEERMEEE